MQNTQTTKEADTSEQAKVTSSTCPSHTNTDRLLPKVRSEDKWGTKSKLSLFPPSL